MYRARMGMWIEKEVQGVKVVAIPLNIVIIFSMSFLKVILHCNTALPNQIFNDLFLRVVVVVVGGWGQNLTVRC